MTKKIILLFITSIALYSYISCKSSTKEMYITSINPIEIKSEPDNQSKTIDKIINATKVVVESEKENLIYIDGQYGKWCLIKTENVKGWVFSGYLRSYNTNELITTAVDSHKKLYKITAVP